MPAWVNTAAFWIVLVIMLVGLFGLVIPIFPGIIIIWLAALAYGLITGFYPLAWILFAVITVLFLVGFTIDNILMNAKAHQAGASWSSLVLGIIAGILGTILLPPLGGLITTPVVVLLVEYLRQHDIKRAWHALRGMLIGWGASFVVRFLIGLVMIALWLVWATKR
jgi:uncharacterized protein YqgC (DUF456 family)